MIKRLIAAAAFITVIGMTSVQAADISFLTAQAPGEWLAYRLVGTNVLDAKGDKIGDVNDVVLDASGRVTTIVIGVGGYLGYNEKSVGVPATAVTVGEVLGGSRIIVLDTTAAALKAAPPYTITDPSRTTRGTKLIKDWSSVAKQKAIEYSKKAAEKATQMKDQATEAIKKQTAK